MRHNLLVGQNSKFGKDVPLVRDVVDHVGVVIGIYGTDPVVHARSIADTLWLQRRVRKGFVQIGDDGACLVNCEITMLQYWHAVEGMQRQMAWLAHVRLQIMKPVRHLLIREDEPHNVDERAARKAVYNEVRHAPLLILLWSANRHRESLRGRLLRCAARAKLLAKLCEGRLHFLEMRMLASTHPFVFGAQKSSFIGFPGL